MNEFVFVGSAKLNNYKRSAPFILLGVQEMVIQERKRV